MANTSKNALKHLNLSPLSLLSFLPWLALLAWLASVAWFLTDDAFISFRYIRNLIDGHGLVFNPGERVEGYTNFLWILELAALWAIFNIRPESAAPWLSVAYTAATIAALLWWTARLPALQSRSLVTWMALGLLCSSATFAVWTSGGGLETRQFTFFIVTAVVCLSLYANSTRGLLIASLSLAAAELTRPEALLLAACCFAWFPLQRLFTDKKISARLLRQTLYLVAPFALIVAAHFLFRYAYYGEWLPNTYYAKHVRPWYESGFRYLWAAALETGLYLLLPLTSLALRSRWLLQRDGIYALPLLCVAAHMAYLLPIGGDHFEYRPLDFYWPLLALPAADAIALLAAKTTASLPRLPQVPLWASGKKICAIALFLPILFYANAVQGTLLFEGAKIRERLRFVFIELNEENAGWLMAAPGMSAITAISNDLRQQSTLLHVGSPLPEHRELMKLQQEQFKPYEKMERGFIPDDALMHQGGLGKFYYIPDLKVIDKHGLVDATVARTPVTHSNADRLMAHDRRPTHNYLKQRGVNFRLFPAVSDEGKALQHAHFAVKFGPELWMPFNVTNAEWAMERFAGYQLITKLTFATTDPDRNFFRAGRSTYVGKSFLGIFENEFDGWKLSGDGISNYSQHADYEGQALIWNRADGGFLTSYHPTKGDRAVGTALSPEFTATADDYLSFLIAGGERSNVGLRLLADGREVSVWRGPGGDWFQFVVHPLGYVAGKTLQLELFDRDTNDLGHVMLDHVMLATCELCPQEPIALARALSAQPANNDSVYLIPAHDVVKSGVKYHLPSQDEVHSLVVPVETPDLAQVVESRLAAAKDLAEVKIVQWNSENVWINDNAQPLTFLLTKFGRFLGSDVYDQFTVHNYADISFKRPWLFYDYLEPLTINYDGGIALQGLALGRGPDQLPLEQPFNLEQERVLWGVLQWQTEPELDSDYAISLRLYDSNGERAFQHDTVLWDHDQWPTSHWPDAEPIETMTTLHLPHDLPAGNYELRLVVYDFETQIPTVQIDVWQPETTLAHLLLAEPR